MRRLLDALHPYAKRGVPIIGIEPSCLYTLRDELKSLIPGKKSELVSKYAMTIEEFLASQDDLGKLSLKLEGIKEKKALLHGHCHQKAFSSMGVTEKVLRLIPGLSVSSIESSCCGMAGAFGYESKNQKISMAMGELNLFPSIRKVKKNTLIVADGTSCRHQIDDGTGRDALHVVRVLERALKGD